MIVNKPPKGWNSWNTFGPDVNEEIIKAAADALVSTGLRDSGYEYVCIDDCWSMENRDENGKIVENREKFPGGIKALSEYIHSKGLKFGMYSCAGLKTCGSFPASYDREFIDAQTFADFGADLLKYDYCFFPNTGVGPNRYHKMSMALRSTGRDILFSACNWGRDNVDTWIRSVSAHMYRSTEDIGERFSAIRDIAVSQYDKFKFMAPGCYNDTDMLVIGMDGKGLVGFPGQCGDTEYKTHMALWCMSSSPLMIGCDLQNMRPEVLELLKHPDLLRIDNDEECRNPIILKHRGEMTPIMFKHLSNREFALAFFNMTDEESTVCFIPAEIGLPANCGFGFKLREIFTGENIDLAPECMNVKLKAHDCSVFMGTYVKK